MIRETAKTQTATVHELVTFWDTVQFPHRGPTANQLSLSIIKKTDPCEQVLVLNVWCGLKQHDSIFLLQTITSDESGSIQNLQGQKNFKVTCSARKVTGCQIYSCQFSGHIFTAAWKKLKAAIYHKCPPFFSLLDYEAPLSF